MSGGGTILCFNAGSSTLKGSLFESRPDGVAEIEGRSVTIDRVPGPEPVDEALRALGVSAETNSIRAIGHRIVHGGTEFREAVRIDAGVRAAIEKLAALAPLHNPPALATLVEAERRFPKVPHVAAFDTAFFSSLPLERAVYPLPYAWYERGGVRRFGFHGLSHQYGSERAEAMLGGGRQRVVILHLGNGCSGSAVVGGTPVATTMGFTPMEGLMMGTRPGSIDPGILLHVLREEGLSVEQLDDVLNHRSGLLGVSGVSGDFRAVESAARAGHEQAKLALAIYADRARAAVGALAASMEGVDVLVFTAGVGEHAAGLRAEVCRGLEFLGLALDLDRNAAAVPDADVSLRGAPGRILVVRTREELVVARETTRLTQPG